ncbi:hypothetical protein IQ07DRAFT_660626 [Pyrenochaeta sp. DS3sAY3a]|nr:hypothetical protein IQ07DRAFT_660626 [Pyrenochaeta sp. DS3sAY3a]
MHMKTLIFLYLAARVESHVFVGNPAPVQWNLDIDKLIMPMNGDPNHLGPEWRQQPFPCKNHHKHVLEENYTTTWYAGMNATLQIFDSTNSSGLTMHDPGAAHSGGSCQVSFSYDDGNTWVVIQSWEGNCVRVRQGQEGQVTNSYDTNQNYTFYIPASLPSGDKVIVAWTWLNATGKREFYMSCSSVRIHNANALAKMPTGFPMFVANLQADVAVLESDDWFWSQCHIPHGVWIHYPAQYRGMNAPIVAKQPPPGSSITFLTLTDTEGICSSDNVMAVEALARSSDLDSTLATQRLEVTSISVVVPSPIRVPESVTCI